VVSSSMSTFGIEVGQTKKQRSGLCFVRPARLVPSVSDRRRSCRASKVEGLAHV
jgi:hypothetical protein